MEHIIVHKLKHGHPAVARLLRENKRLDRINAFLSEIVKILTVFTIIHLSYRLIEWSLT